jgi:hypothetical protein
MSWPAGSASSSVAAVQLEQCHGRKPCSTKRVHRISLRAEDQPCNRNQPGVQPRAENQPERRESIPLRLRRRVYTPNNSGVGASAWRKSRPGPAPRRMQYDVQGRRPGYTWLPSHTKLVSSRVGGDRHQAGLRTKQRSDLRDEFAREATVDGLRLGRRRRACEATAREQTEGRLDDV